MNQLQVVSPKMEINEELFMLVDYLGRAELGRTFAAAR